jgi:hypothetical protein
MFHIAHEAPDLSRGLLAESSNEVIDYIVAKNAMEGWEHTSNRGTQPRHLLKIVFTPEEEKKVESSYARAAGRQRVVEDYGSPRSDQAV